MADKTDDMMKQTAKELSDAGLLRMYNSEQKTIAEGNNTPYHQRRKQAAEEELQARLDSYSKLDSFELGDLDNVIAMAGAVSGFSQQADMAKKVLDKAQAQKASLTPEQLNEAALASMMKDSSYNKNDLDAALDAGAQYNQEISEAKEQEAKQETVENVQPETKESKEETKEESKEGSTETKEDVKEDEDTITPEADQALTKAEKEPESQEALNAYDNANKVPQMDAETLEANGNIMDAVNREFTPFARDGQQNLVHPEFQAEFDAMQAMNFTYDNEKELSEEEQNKLREDLVQAAMLEAELYARSHGNGNPEDVANLYKSKLKECLQGGMVATAFASEYKRGLTREQMAAKMLEIVEKQPSVKKSAVMAHTSNTKEGSQKLVDRIKNKFKEIPAVKKMQEKINAFDKRMSERYGKKYDIAKRYAKLAFKTVKNVAIYSAVGATAGPIGLAVLSAKSGYDAYKNLENEAKNHGMTLKEFAKANKGKVGLACAMSGLSLVGSVFGLGVQTGIGGTELASKVQPILKTATKVLAVAPKAGSTLIHGVKAAYKRFSGDKEGAKVEWDKTKAAAARTSEAALGIFLGSAAAEYFAGDNHTPTEDSSSKSSSTTVLNEDNTINWDKTMTHDWQNGTEGQTAPEASSPSMSNSEAQQTSENVAPSQTADSHVVLNDDNTVNWDKTMTHDWQNGAEGQTAPDADHDGIPDTIDKDAGHGWANEENYTEDQKFWDSRADKFLGEQTTEDLYARIASGEIKLPEGIETPQEFAYKLSMAMEQTPGLVAEDLGVKFQTSAQFEAGIKDMTPEQFEKLSGLMNDFDDRGHYTGERPLYQPEVQRDTPEPTPETTPEPKEPLEEVHDEVVQVDMRTPQEQRAYDAILNIISKGEDMNNPEVRASVEGLAQSHLQEIQDAIARGDNLALAEKIAALHNQGENQELAEATRSDENDSRKMANAKEDVLEAKAKLDAAKEALAQDPDNEKLQKEVAKLEQKFDKESLDLEQREIKEARSDLKDQIKQDEKAFDNRNKAHETIEQNYGISEFDVNKKLAEMGVNVNNLPEDKSTLSQEAQDLLNIRDMYQQAHQNEADLQNRIQENEQLREDLKTLEKESKAEEKAVKRGEGLSIDAQERLAGQSQVENSELLNSVIGIQNEQAQIQEMNENRGKNAYEQNMANEEQKIMKNHDKEIGRQVSSLRGTVHAQPTAAVQQTTVNQQVIQNQGGRQ